MCGCMMIIGLLLLIRIIRLRHEFILSRPLAGGSFIA